MNTARSSFPLVGNVHCHKCRNGNPVPGKDPGNHLCLPNNELYINYNVSVTDLVEKSDTLVGGFILPTAYVVPGYTMLPCPLECIHGSNSSRIWKIAHGAASSGLCYIYLTTTGAVTLVFYRVDGTRESTRSLPSISRLSVYFNRFRNGLTNVPPTANPGVHGAEGGFEA